MPNKYSFGIDQIPIFLIKYIAFSIKEPLATIINNCFVPGTFPDLLKKAKVIPVFKKGDRHSANNYRPVSILPAVSKIFERATYVRLMNFLNAHNILSNEQFGFRPSKSTEKAIFHTLSYVIERIDQNDKVAGLYFDLSKAFDTIDHKLLLLKLNRYGIRGTVADLFKSYLSDRTQNVCITSNGVSHYGPEIRIGQGVPQGSILGPVLFLLYANDLPDFVDGRVCPYADDTSVILAHDSVRALSGACSGAAGQMSDWCERNSLRLNAGKTGLLFFEIRKQNISLHVRLDNKSVPEMNSIKFLGVHLDATLSWDRHIDSLLSRLGSACALIRRLRYCVFLDSLISYYFSNIQSIINYGISFWGASGDAIKVFRAQKRIIRCLLHLHPRTSCKPHFSKLHILTVPSLYFLALVTFVKGNYNLFSANRDFYSENMSIETRGRADLRIPQHSTTFFKKGTYYKGIKAFQSLPEEIKNIENTFKFKKAVIKYLEIRCFYSFTFEF